MNTKTTLNRLSAIRIYEHIVCQDESGILSTLRKRLAGAGPLVSDGAGSGSAAAASGSGSAAAALSPAALRAASRAPGAYTSALGPWRAPRRPPPPCGKSCGTLGAASWSD